MAKLVYTDQSGREITQELGPDSPVVTVGRAKDCTIRSNRKSVSRRHAEFRWDDGRFQVTDLDSSNGTYVIVDNQRKPVGDPEGLTHRDEIWCGDFILYFLDEEPDVDTDPEPVAGGGIQAGAGGSVSEAEPTVSAGSGGGVSTGRGDSIPPEGGGVTTGRGDSIPPEGGVGGDVQPARGSTEPPEAEPPEGGVGVGRGGSESLQVEQVGIDEATQGVEDELDRLRSEKESIQALADRQTRRADDLEDELEETRAELEQTRAELQEARSGPDRAREARELREELEEKEQQIERLERDLEREVEAGQRLQDSLDEYEERIDTLEDERDELQADVRRLRGERDDLEEQLNRERADAEETEAELQKLRGEVQRLESELDQARATSSSGPTGGADVDVERLAELAENLNRIVDAFRRTDLSELSTVDRVRLESALDDTEPTETLEEMLERLGADRD